MKLILRTLLLLVLLSSLVCGEELGKPAIEPDYASAAKSGGFDKVLKVHRYATEANRHGDDSVSVVCISSYSRSSVTTTCSEVRAFVWITTEDRILGQTSGGFLYSWRCIKNCKHNVVSPGSYYARDVNNDCRQLRHRTVCRESGIEILERRWNYDKKAGEQHSKLEASLWTIDGSYGLLTPVESERVEH